MPVEFPTDQDVAELLPPVEFPTLYEVRQEPEAPTVDDPEAIAREEVGRLPLDELDAGATVAVGLGSRGITDVVAVAQGVVSELQDRGFEVVAMPAMGSHGGASAEGQRETLAALGMDEETLDCPVDARMETSVLGTSELGNEVHFADAALEADAVLVVNRVKAHTNFSGTFESGLTKMSCIGLGKQSGAQAIHERSIVDGYEETLRATFEVIREHVDHLGGVAIVENFYDETAEIRAIPVEDLPDGEGPLLERSYEYMPTLPYDEIDVLVVDELGKDVSGAGMDPNVVGRFNLINMEDPEYPDVKRIYVRGLTEATHGNGMGIGNADVTTVDVAESIDYQQVYANAITSGSIEKAAIPMAVETEELAFAVAISTMGAWDPETVRMAWIENTGHLADLTVSEALAEEARDRDDLVVGRALSLGFDDDGDPVLEQAD
ncbi:MAG: DUF362 domain-containing protein [Halobacteriaceae archaeon]